jgi:hypothetical protein
LLAGPRLAQRLDGERIEALMHSRGLSIDVLDDDSGSLI